ncbi:MAG TPA: hypothetical protein VFH68_09095 [Polyangia bacterium]|nr:hypothetical protein [Polyangia bacterium]
MSASLISSLAFAQDAPAPAAAPAPAPAAGPAPEAAPATTGPAAAEPKKKHGGGLGLSLDPNAPQQGAPVVPIEVVAPPEESGSSEWKFDITGYFRAPLRMSWGPPTRPEPNAAPGSDAGTQFRTPPRVPDWNYIDWRYTNSMVGPWTELNFHYGNSRVKATVQVASYNLTDAGYRRLESNLGINQSYLSINWPELWDENSRLTLTVGGYTNRYGAAGRYDGGKYETYLFGRTHVTGETATLEYDIADWTASFEEGIGAKLEPIPWIGPPADPSQNLTWNPFPGPQPQESTFVAHAHFGASYKKMLLIGAHYINTFANDNERAGGYKGGMGATYRPFQGRPSSIQSPHIVIYGADVKLLGGVLGDGYLGYAHLDARNAEYLGDAIETIHSFGGWQLHDNYFGQPGNFSGQHATGKVDTILFQHVFSFGQLFRYPQNFWGDGPDLIASLFAMYNKVSGATNNYNHSRLKAGAELTYLPLSWFGIGGRYDIVDPNLDDTTQNFSVFSPRIILKSAFVTHEQILIQYSRYFYGANAAVSQFPYNGGSPDYPHNQFAQALGADKNAFTIAAIIWF